MTKNQYERYIRRRSRRNWLPRVEAAASDWIVRHGYERPAAVTVSRADDRGGVYVRADWADGSVKHFEIVAGRWQDPATWRNQ
jgi:hypothetical protein